jgi:hypothetical protein
MATYDYTKGGTTKLSQTNYGKHFVAKIRVSVPDIIASDATLTAAGKIAAADIIQLIDWPINFVITHAAMKVITAGTAAATYDVGLAGGTELLAAQALDAVAGTVHMMAVAAGWGPDNYTGWVLTTTDTIDMQFIADTVIGVYDLYIAGFELW